MLSKEARRELLVIGSLFAIVVACWASISIYNDIKENARKACIDSCERKEVHELIKSNMPDKEILARVPQIKNYCKRICNRESN